MAYKILKQYSRFPNVVDNIIISYISYLSDDDIKINYMNNLKMYKNIYALWEYNDMISFYNIYEEWIPFILLCNKDKKFYRKQKNEFNDDDYNIDDKIRLIRKVKNHITIKTKKKRKRIFYKHNI